MGKLVLTPDDLVTTPEAGMLEFDGIAPRFSLNSTQRSLIPGMMVYITPSQVIGLNATGNQSMLGVGVTLQADQVYNFVCNFNMFKTAGTTSHTMSFGWGGTVGINRIVSNIMLQQSDQGFITVSASRSPNFYVLETSNMTVLTGAMATAFRTVNFQIHGTIATTTGGTLVPQYSLSAAPGGAYSTAGTSGMSIWPVGSQQDGTLVNIGNWA